ncbi:hypothetical protein CR513_54460, partial [Mucuna pruriens]
MSTEFDNSSNQLADIFTKLRCLPYKREIRNCITYTTQFNIFCLFNSSKFMKTGDKIYQLLNNFVKDIGEKNVIQVVTDNESNYVMTGKLLQARKTKLFWTPCAAH